MNNVPASLMSSGYCTACVNAKLSAKLLNTHNCDRHHGKRRLRAHDIQSHHCHS